LTWDGDRIALRNRSHRQLEREGGRIKGKIVADCAKRRRGYCNRQGGGGPPKRIKSMGVENKDFWQRSAGGYTYWELPCLSGAKKNYYFEGLETSSGRSASLQRGKLVLPEVVKKGHCGQPRQKNMSCSFELRKHPKEAQLMQESPPLVVCTRPL